MRLITWLVGAAIAVLIAWSTPHVWAIRSQALKEGRLLAALGAAKKPQGAITVRAFVATGAGGYQGPLAAVDPGLVAELKPFPVILSLAGCGWAHDTQDLPKRFVLLSAHEDPERLQRPILPRACSDRDAVAIRRALSEQLDVLVAEVGRHPWLDHTRVVLRASGEAGPLAAAYTGKLSGRVIVDEPCLVRWQTIENGAPMVLLFSAPAARAQRPATTIAPFDCRPLPRPAFPAGVAVAEFKSWPGPPVPISSEMSDTRRKAFAAFLR
ncbi:MAG: hypothetical protein AB7F78_04230 [Hyphomicrobiaceae bacterium]